MLVPVRKRRFVGRSICGVYSQAQTKEAGERCPNISDVCFDVGNARRTGCPSYWKRTRERQAAALSAWIVGTRCLSTGLRRPEMAGRDPVLRTSCPRCWQCSTDRMFFFTHFFLSEIRFFPRFAWVLCRTHQREGGLRHIR